VPVRPRRGRERRRVVTDLLDLVLELGDAIHVCQFFQHLRIRRARTRAERREARM
jgi:hypothetical protein